MIGRSTRFILAGYSLTLATTCAYAELQVIEDADGQQGLTVFRMTVTPAAESVPALKHRLTLREIDMRAGNAAPFYMRGLAESSLSSKWKGIRQKYGDAADDWYDIDDIPITELPLDKMRDAAARFDNHIKFFIDPASRCKSCDWGLGLEHLRGADIYNLLLPDFQESRAYSRMLMLLARLAIAEQRYDDAIDYLRMNYRMGYHVGQGPFFVCGLVGIAEVGLSNQMLIDLIASPDSPNMYWALAELPEPLVDLRQSVRVEMSLLPRIISSLGEAQAGEFSEKQWSELFHKGFRQVHEVDSSWNMRMLKWVPNDATMRQAIGTSAALLEYPAAKHRLIQSGLLVEKVEEMPVGKVLLLDASREVRRIGDELEKWFYTDYVSAQEGIRQAELERERSSASDGIGGFLTRMLMPALQAVHGANARMGWQINALKTVEALRMHAAANGGFPQTLDEISVVPVPNNPITGEQYVYRLDGSTAVLELPFSDGISGVAWRFELQLAEK